MKSRARYHAVWPHAPLGATSECASRRPLGAVESAIVVIVTVPRVSKLADIDVPKRPLWRRALPFVVATALVAFVVLRLDTGAFLGALGRVSRGAFFGVTAGFIAALLVADTFGSVVLYRLTVAPMRYVDFFLLRGASYLPSLLNHHVGQAFLTYFLSRAYGVSLVRVAGSTLVAYAVWAGCILSFGTVSLAVVGDPTWLVLFVASGVTYLVILRVRPAWLEKRSLFAPLFEVGVVGHLVALAARVPHFFVLFFGHWALFEVFGIDIPWHDAVLYLPVLMVVTTLPITPQGFGTRDAFSALVFARYASGATEAERLAQVGAATLSWGIALTLLQAVVGLVLMRLSLARFGGDAGDGHPRDTSALVARRR